MIFLSKFGASQSFNCLIVMPLDHRAETTLAFLFSTLCVHFWSRDNWGTSQGKGLERIGRAEKFISRLSDFNSYLCRRVQSWLRCLVDVSRYPYIEQIKLLLFETPRVHSMQRQPTYALEEWRYVIHFWAHRCQTWFHGANKWVFSLRSWFTLSQSRNYPHFMVRYVVQQSSLLVRFTVCNCVCRFVAC